MELVLEEKLMKLREEYKKTGDPVKREIIKRQARALNIADNSKDVQEKF